jgi:long-chain fatty acid transport protein
MRRSPSVPFAATALLAGLAAPALATNGYFAHGYGTQYKGIAGAGVALHLDTLAAATNPAAMAFVGDRFDLSLSAFSPDRYYTVTGNPSGYPGTFGLTPGEVRSDSRLFPVPALGANWRVGEDGSLGVSVYGNGGMNTNWPTATFYASNPTGVNLDQIFVAPTYAHKFAGRHALGLTAIGALQWFKAEGVASFADFSSSPSNLSDNGYSYAVGGGLRVGYLGEWSRYLSLGASYQTKIAMGRFEKYAGLFADRGAFDVPASWTAGVALHPAENVDLAVDVQQILYSKVASVGNPLLPNLMQAPLGADSGAGFGWKDVTAVKAGVQVRAGHGWTLRGGWSHCGQPVPESEVLFNILAPGVVENQLTLGFSKVLSDTQQISFAVMRAFQAKVTGPNPLEVPGLQSIELRMSEWDFEIGWSFGIRK